MALINFPICGAGILPALMNQQDAGFIQCFKIYPDSMLFHLVSTQSIGMSSEQLKMFFVYTYQGIKI